MKNKLKYLGFLPLLAIIGYIFYLNYEIREFDKQTKEGFKNRDNATLYFEDCSSISIDKGLIQTITDFSNRYGGENYQSDISSESFNYNGHLIYLSLSRSERTSRKGSLQTYDNICLYKSINNNNIKSDACPVLESWYESFGRDSFWKPTNCK